MKSLLVVCMLATGFAHAGEPVVIPAGKLGLSLGSYLTIEGHRAPAIDKRGKVTKLKSSPLCTLAVDTVNGKKLGKPVLIVIENLAGQYLPSEARIVIRGYESGRMVGVPSEVARVENLPVPQAIWHFHRHFVLTSCVEPKALPKKEKAAPARRGSPAGPERRRAKTVEQPAQHDAEDRAR